MITMIIDHLDYCDDYRVYYHDDYRDYRDDYHDNYHEDYQDYHNDYCDDYHEAWTLNLIHQCHLVNNIFLVF